MKVNLEGKVLWLNFHHLFCFYKIALLGSIQRASSELKIGQSALSIQMKQFEESIGMAIFDRSHKKITVNEKGQILFSYAKEIFRLGQELVGTIQDKNASNKTHLQIGALDTIPKHLTTEIVIQAIQRQSMVSVIEGKLETLFKDLLEYRIDLLVTNRVPLEESNRVYVNKIGRFPLWVVGSRKFLGLKRNFPRSLQGEKFVVPTFDSHVRYEFESFCANNKIKPDLVAETQDIMVQKLLAIRGMGLSIMPEFAVSEYIAKKELFLMGKISGCFEELFLVSNFRKIENPAAAYFMKNFYIK